MKILISNDDGYQAPGLVALYEALKTIADVEVVAPELNNSAKSNALTLHSPLHVETAANGFRNRGPQLRDDLDVGLHGRELGWITAAMRAERPELGDWKVERRFLPGCHAPNL